MASSVQIIPYYAHPHVHTVITDNTWYDETVGVPRDPDELPYSTCVVTGADMGIDNRFVRLSSLRTKIALFGRGNFDKYGQSSLQADQLFNGQTNVWFCRVLPDDATYANLILMAHFRQGNILDELNQETGLTRMEVKFTIEHAAPPALTNGATDEDMIYEWATQLSSLSPDPQTGYRRLPLCFVRAIGRGQYGNRYSMRFQRNVEAEREYGMKMLRFTLLQTDMQTRIVNEFGGSLYQTTRFNLSTLIDDVLDQFPTGSAPVRIHTFKENYTYLYSFYKDVVLAANEGFVLASGTPEQKEEFEFAARINPDTFDPIFGFRINTRTDEQIPYYRNYTVRQEQGPWVDPNLTVDTGTKPENITEWNTAFPGARVLVLADPLNDGLRWMYTVMSVDQENGNIVYNEGWQVEIDAEEYVGYDLRLPVGHRLYGGHDGVFQEITTGGDTRPPVEAELKLLLSREYVKAFRGEKDRSILSPARINIDFMLDANYNMTGDGMFNVDTHIAPMFHQATVLTDRHFRQLAALGSDSFIADLRDINVKAAMYDLNEFRNRNGMTINLAEGAGCLLHLDTNLVGLRGVGVADELTGVIDMMEDFDGRATSIDLGYYQIFDPYTGKRISVTTMYFLAQRLVPHLITQGLSRPFANTWAQLRAINRNSRVTGVSGQMIRDSFRPDIDLIDWDVKERLFTSRFNYYETGHEGRIVTRAVQNTRQRDASALLEENNMRVLNSLKKGLEAACKRVLFNWNEPEARQGFTDAQMEIYRPWIGTMVQDLSIVFTANEWEQERMMLRCHVEVAFRDIIKRVILHININRPENMHDGGGV